MGKLSRRLFLRRSAEAAVVAPVAAIASSAPKAEAEEVTHTHRDAFSELRVHIGPRTHISVFEAEHFDTPEAVLLYNVHVPEGGITTFTHDGSGKPVKIVTIAQDYTYRAVDACLNKGTTDVHIDQRMEPPYLYP